MTDELQSNGLPHLPPNFIIDAASDEDYLYVVVRGMGTVVIKREDEGIVVDIFPLHVADTSVASTWAHINDLIDPEAGCPTPSAPKCA